MKKYEKLNKNNISNELHSNTVWPLKEELNFANYLDFENFFEEIKHYKNKYFCNYDKVKQEYEKLYQERLDNYINDINLNNPNNQNLSLSLNQKMNDNDNTDKINFEQYLTAFFNYKKKLNKNELKKNYVNIKNVIKFTSRTDKSVDIKKLTKMSIDRDKVESRNNFKDRYQLKYKKGNKLNVNNNSNNNKNGLFSTHSSFINHIIPKAKFDRKFYYKL